MSFMNFYFHEDEKMSKMISNLYRFKFKGAGQKDFVLFFGAREENSSLRAYPDDSIRLSFRNDLRTWAPKKYFSRHSLIEPTTPNGLMYLCIGEGVTGDQEPAWETVPKRTQEDGSITWQCQGAPLRVDDIKMALTRKGLDSAKAGAALDLGDKIQGGQAIPIYFRVNNADDTPRSDGVDRCLKCDLNEVILSRTP